VGIGIAIAGQIAITHGNEIAVGEAPTDSARLTVKPLQSVDS
jgi:hypothetical protein